MLEGVDRHEQLNDPVRDGRAGGLDDEDVRLADILLDLDEQVLVGKAQDRRAAEIGAQVLADVPRQLRMGRAANHLDGADQAPSWRMNRVRVCHEGPPRRAAAKVTTWPSLSHAV